MRAFETWIIILAFVLGASGCRVLAQPANSPSPTLPEMSWTMINVNATSKQGDAHLLEFPDGETDLVDVGNRGEYILPFLKNRGIRIIHKVFISHPHHDHYGSLSDLLKEVDIKSVYMNLPERDVCDRERPWGCDYGDVVGLMDQLKKRNIPVRPIKAGQVFYSKGKTRLEVLYAYNGSDSPIGKTDINDTSAILLLTNGITRALFTGDLNSSLGAYLAKNGRNLEADILKVPHHGGEGLAPNEFFDRVHPKVALIPAPKWLWFDDRSKRVRDYMAAKKTGVYVNGLHGTITVRFQNGGFTVSAEQKHEPAPEAR